MHQPDLRDLGSEALVGLLDPGQRVLPPVHVGVVDLIGISGQYDLGVGPTAGDDRLHLMRREVLRFVADQEFIGQKFEWAQWVIGYEIMGASF